MKDFNYWEKQYKSEKLEEFNFDQSGLLWLKIKSIIRKELIAEFTKESKIALKEMVVDKQFIEIYAILVKDIEQSHQLLEDFIQKINAKQVRELDT